MDRVDDKIKKLVRENEKEISYEHWVELMKWMLDELEIVNQDIF